MTDHNTRCFKNIINGGSIAIVVNRNEKGIVPSGVEGQGPAPRIILFAESHRTICESSMRQTQGLGACPKERTGSLGWVAVKLRGRYWFRSLKSERWINAFVVNSVTSSNSDLEVNQRVSGAISPFPVFFAVSGCPFRGQFGDAFYRPDGFLPLWFQIY